ncbi:hypothetical protein TIFTF001_040776, partial [Ficus carica]
MWLKLTAIMLTNAAQWQNQTIGSTRASMWLKLTNISHTKAAQWQ